MQAAGSHFVLGLSENWPVHSKKCLNFILWHLQLDLRKSVNESNVHFSTNVLNYGNYLSAMYYCSFINFYSIVIKSYVG